MSDASKPTPNPEVEPKLTDHNYDGIQEYDNPLPGWWKGLFWATIGFSVLYWAWFEAGPGDGIFEQYEASVAKAEAEKEALRREKLAGMEVKPDAPTMLALMADEETMAAQAKVWQQRCQVCHNDGRGVANLGPNMTDDAYVHVKTLEDFPRIVENGIIEKGMTPFKGQLSDEEIVLIAAYAASLRGIELDPANTMPIQDAQGEVIPPWPPLEEAGASEGLDD